MVGGVLVDSLWLLGLLNHFLLALDDVETSDLSLSGIELLLDLLRLFLDLMLDVLQLVILLKGKDLRFLLLDFALGNLLDGDLLGDLFLFVDTLGSVLLGVVFGSAPVSATGSALADFLSEFF